MIGIVCQIGENGQYFEQKKARTDNSTYPKVAVQWLNKAMGFMSSTVQADSFVLRNRQLLAAAKH